MLSAAKRLIPIQVKLKIRGYLSNRREARCRAKLFGELAPLVPPVERMFEGPQSLEEYRSNGEEFLKIYQELCGLRPDEKMLDVGSGIGRKTLPLTQYFNERAIYEGIDIKKSGVDWCRERITSRFGNFHFQHIDVHNKHYNPEGRYQPSEYRFPFVDESFDFVMLGSVFTHMLPDDVKNYLSEVHRVLKSGGRCLITYFLLNGESLRLIKSGDTTLDFRYAFDKHRSISGDLPEQAIALDQRWISDLYEKLGLKIMRLDYGSWCAREKYLSYQDLVLAVKGRGDDLG